MLQPVIFGKKLFSLLFFLKKSYFTKFRISDCCLAILTYWWEKKVAIHNCFQRSRMRCRRTLEGVEKWLCSISEREIRPDCGVLIIDRHLLSNKSCWSALKRWRRPDRFGCACPLLIKSVIRMCSWSSYSSFVYWGSDLFKRFTQAVLSVSPKMNKSECHAVTRCVQSLESVPNSAI